MATLISGSTGVNKITDGTITNADIASGAAIAGSKLVMPTGSVLQVVHTNYGTTVNTSSDSMVDTGLQASITPQSTSNKILISVNVSDPFKNTTGTSGGIDMRIVRGSTSIHAFALANLYTGTTMQNNGTPMSATYLDSPSSTSSTTYKVQYKRYASAGGYSVGINASGGISTLTLTEIAG